MHRNLLDCARPRLGWLPKRLLSTKTLLLWPPYPPKRLAIVPRLRHRGVLGRGLSRSIPAVIGRSGHRWSSQWCPPHWRRSGAVGRSAASQTPSRTSKLSGGWGRAKVSHDVRVAVPMMIGIDGGGVSIIHHGAETHTSKIKAVQ